MNYFWPGAIPFSLAVFVGLLSSGQSKLFSFSSGDIIQRSSWMGNLASWASFDFELPCFPQRFLKHGMFRLYKLNKKPHELLVQFPGKASLNKLGPSVVRLSGCIVQYEKPKAGVTLNRDTLDWSNAPEHAWPICCMSGYICSHEIMDSSFVNPLEWPFPLYGC